MLTSLTGLALFAVLSLAMPHGIDQSIAKKSQLPTTTLKELISPDALGVEASSSDGVYVDKLPSYIDLGHGIKVSTDPGWIDTLYEGTDVWAYLGDGYGQDIASACNQSIELGEFGLSDVFVTKVADPSRVVTIKPTGWKLRSKIKPVSGYRFNAPIYNGGELTHRQISEHVYECVTITFILKSDNPLSKIQAVKTQAK